MPKELRYPQGSERIPVRVRCAALCLKRKLQRRGAHRVPRRYARAPPSPPHPPCTSSCGPASSAVQRHIDSSSSPSISPHASTPPTALACTRR
ncbi:hypothetical protein HETIRDRAFT_439400 [Heterobasidion irregulare TC 32-1]|uniref:Uncharacterized protein n=1 Tax=Heterobasidion irregulare (strain TC 32-1) TaxID=747525 RepID=W4K992_HETIT|nr:uncharacterized protein HETIRDRAFT_439400 [Heterobasidion irregulare TC 32-1]ETW82348.1 hypothetical protein HETIRDRAFT_439400 [Heterobasidion irregulare TC 32-1]